VGEVQIYALSDPDTGVIRYIGKANCAQKRFYGHLREYRRSKTPVYCWIKSLRERGAEPTLTIITTCSKGEWKAVEKEEIAKARAKDSRLLNVADGGDEPNCTVEQRRAAAIAATKVRDRTYGRMLFHKRMRALGISRAAALKSGNFWLAYKCLFLQRCCRGLFA
jgi:hypothetical protein